MESTKKILNVAIAFSLVVLSISAFIFSIRGNQALAVPSPSVEGFIPVGSYTLVGKDENQREQTYICIVGYDPKTKEIKQLSNIDINRFKISGRK